MEQLNKKDKNTFLNNYYLVYTGVFLFCALCMSLYLLFQGKTNINYVNDGMNQHFRGMLYFSDYLQTYLRDLFVDHQIQPLMWDFSIGEGSDILTTLHSYSFADPLCFINVLVPDKYMYLAFLFNSFLRLYLAGLFFSKLCFYLNIENKYGILAGALAYAFCFWGLKNFTMHLSFLVPLMYLPLLILGTEKIINGDKPYTLIIGIALSCATFFYFFYMEALATAIYGISRLISKFYKTPQEIFKKLIIILLSGLLGLGIAAVILFPVLHSYLGDSRLGFEYWLNLLYPAFFYERLFTIFLSNDSPYDLCMGFVSICILSCSLVLKDFKKNKLLLFFNILCVVFVAFPVFGKIFNGMAYVSQRWSFIIALPVCFDLAYKWDEIFDLKNQKYFLFVIAASILLALYSAWSRNERVFIPIAICILSYLLSISKINTKIRLMDLKQALLICLIIFNVFYIYEYNLSERGGETIEDLLSISDAKNIKSLSEASVIKKITENDDEFNRYAGNMLTNNASMTHKTNSTNFYFSITNPADQKFRMLLGMRDTFNIQIAGYDDRTPLEALANVKYYITEAGSEITIPYGFVFDRTEDGYDIYTNDYYLPFGYTYDKATAYEEWETMTMLERQESMMNQITVEDPLLDSDSVNNIEEIPYTIIAGEGVEVKDKEIITSNKKDKITLKFESPVDIEHYLSFTGIRHNDIYNIVEDDVTNAVVYVNSSDGAFSNFLIKTKAHRYNYGKTDFVCYMGHPIEPVTEIEISFSVPGSYTYENMTINSVDTNGYRDKIADLSEDLLKNVKFGINSVSGDVSNTDDKYLLLSIPYSKGWKAFVDGKEVPLLQANQHYLSVYLEKGDHHIEMKYTTPGIILGAGVSAVSILLFIVLLFADRKKGQ